MIKRPEYESVEFYECELEAQYTKYDVIANGVAHRLIGLAETLREDHLKEAAVREITTLAFILDSAATKVELAQDDLRKAKKKEASNDH